MWVNATILTIQIRVTVKNVVQNLAVPFVMIDPTAITNNSNAKSKSARSWKESIANNMTDAEVIELLREIKRLKDYIKTLDNHNARIINQNRELQQELRNLTQK